MNTVTTSGSSVLVNCIYVSTPTPAPRPNLIVKMDYKHPVHMVWWNITPGQDLIDSKPMRLHRKKWVGICVSLVSNYEVRAIKAFIGALPKGDVHRCRTFIEMGSDERPGDIGPFPSRSMSFYFRKEEDREAFKAMLAAIPKRTIEIVIDKDKRPSTGFQSVVKGKNWMLLSGEEGWLLSAEDSLSDADLVMLKLLLG